MLTFFFFFCSVCLCHRQLSTNNLRGSIPTEIGSLTSLQFLYVHLPLWPSLFSYFLSLGEETGREKPRGWTFVLWKIGKEY
jgi:hypothetical protein